MTVNKYRAKRTPVDGITFASAKEARRYLELKVLQKAGVISDLRLQPRFPLSVNGFPICTYVADFAFEEAGCLVVEDAKGFKTPVYRLKAKLFAALHGFSVREV